MASNHQKQQRRPTAQRHGVEYAPHKQSSDLPSMRRLVATFFTVILTIGIGGYFAGRLNHQLDKIQSVKRPQATSKEIAELGSPYFYKTIGSSLAASSATRLQSQTTQSKYTVLIKTVTSQSEAEKIMAQLAQKGVSAYYTPVQGEGRVLYHIRLGIYNDQRDAEATLATLENKLKIKGQVSVLQ
jgi:septal ring-binding cell division protein DamX